jgi:hypothetical protein
MPMDELWRGSRSKALMLNRIGTYLIVAGFSLSLSTPSFAIEKKKKDASATKTDTTQSAVKPTLKSTPPVQPTQPIKQPPSVTTKVFNDFIDVNKNGFDDRLEQGLKAEPKKLPVTPAVDVKKADSTKAQEKAASDKASKKSK